MRHDTATMREWLASVPDGDLVSIVAVTPALRRAMAGSTDLDELRLRIRDLTGQQVEGLTHAFLAGVAQQLRTDGFTQAEIDDPGPEDLRAMLVDHLPAAHARLALHALLIGSGPASSTARAHARHLLTALDEELPITATTHDDPSHDAPTHDSPTHDSAAAADIVARLRTDAAVLAPGLRAAADAVEAGTVPADAAQTAGALQRFAAELAGLLDELGGAGDLAAADVRLAELAEQERLAAERALVLDHRAGIEAMARRAEGGPAFLRERYATLLAEIDKELAGPRYARPDGPLTEQEARTLLAGTGIDEELVAVLAPWPQLCEPGDHIPRADVGEVVTAEASSVPDLLHRLESLGVLHENADGEVALDELTLRCLSLLPAAG